MAHRLAMAGDDEITQVKVRLPAHLKRALEESARLNGWSVNQEVVARIAAGLGQADNAVLAEENIAASLAILVSNRQELTKIRRSLMRRLAELSPNDPLIAEINEARMARILDAPSGGIDDPAPPTKKKP
jgi:hypothetical protein